MSSQFSLLNKRRFLPLFLTQFLGAFNDNAFKTSIGILATYHAGRIAGLDPKMIVNAGAGIFVLPFFLFSATAGQLADKYDKAKMIRIVRFIEIPFMLLAILGFALENYYLLLAVLFCAGVQAAFFGPLKYSILPQHLKDSELVGGNALVEAGTFAAILLGTIAGGTLILSEHGVAVISVILLVVAVSAWAISFGIASAPSRSPRLRVSLNFLAETWRLTRRAYAEKDVFLSIIGISWFWLVGSVFITQFAPYANTILHADPAVVTLFLTVFSLGIAFGSLICNKLLKGKVSGVYVPVGAFGMMVSIFLFWLATPQVSAQTGLVGLTQFLDAPGDWLLLASLLSVSVFGGIYIVPLYTIMQTRCEESFRSRTIAVNNVMNALFMVAGSVATMILLKMQVTIPQIFLIVGLANIPVVFLARRLVFTESAFNVAGKREL
jgi:acyl-[acyl-carrier-protein]-phospholipid O-acyltransferase/long-chain-fatty-acid--[acyl-carrier-protein] ligase